MNSHAPHAPTAFHAEASAPPSTAFTAPEVDELVTSAVAKSHETPRTRPFRCALKRAGLVLAAIVVGAGFLSATPGAVAATSCGTFRDPDGARIAVRIVKGKPSCAKAKGTLRSYALAVKRDGCSSNACTKQFGIVTCGSATAGAFPRLYTCATDKLRYSAYSTAD